MKRFLVAGLGNPEGQYFGTWHNLGFVAAEKLASILGACFSIKGNALTAAASNVIVVKPLTYMNRSGEAVVHLKRKKKIASERILIFVDDVYIEKGKIKIIRGGTSGHNGTRSIRDHLGSEEYIRIKIGCKPAREMADISGYVLSRVPEAERELIDEALNKAVTAVQLFLSGETLEAVQMKFNSNARGEGV